MRYFSNIEDPDEMQHNAVMKTLKIFSFETCGVVRIQDNLVEMVTR